MKFFYSMTMFDNDSNFVKISDSEKNGMNIMFKIHHTGFMNFCEYLRVNLQVLMLYVCFVK